MRQQHVEFLGRKLAIVKVMPLRPQPVETCPILGNSRRHRPEQFSFRALPERIGGIPFRAEVLFPSQTGQQRANGQQAFLLEVVVANRNRGLEIVQVDDFGDLVVLAARGLGICRDGQRDRQDQQSRSDLSCVHNHEEPAPG